MSKEAKINLEALIVKRYAYASPDYPQNLLSECIIAV